MRRADGVRVIPLSLTAAGADEVRFSGATGSTRFDLPVPAGLEPVALDGIMVSAPDIVGGSIEYVLPGVATRVVTFDQATDDGERDTVATTRSESAGRTDVQMDLSAGTLTTGRLPITLLHSLRADDDFCGRDDVGGWAEFRGAFLLEGEPTAPDTIAEFATPLLQQLEIVIPDSPSDAEVEAAVRLGASLRRASLNPEVDIDVVADGDASSADDLDTLTGRRVVIERSAETRVFLDTEATVPTLVVTASDDDASRSVTDSIVSTFGTIAVVDEIAIGITETAVDGGAASDDLGPVALDDGVTSRFEFADLGLVRERRSGLGVMESSFSTNQALLGGPIETTDLSIHLVHTEPPPDSVATASIVVNGILVSSRNLDLGPTDFDIRLEGSSLPRGLTIEVVVDYAPPGGQCRPRDAEFTWQVEPFESTIDVSGGQVLDAGFERFPQNLTGGVMIGLDDRSPFGVEVATRLFTAVERSGGVALRPSVVSVSEAVDSDLPALLIDGSGSVFETAAAPIGLDPIRVREDQPRFDALRVDTDDALAVLQAWADENHDLMAVTWQEGSEQSARDVVTLLLERLDTANASFSSLTGDVLVVSASAPPANLSLTGAATVPTPVRLAPPYRGRILSILGIGVACVVVAGAIWLVRRRRRSDTDDTPQSQRTQSDT